jgi:hypothetical protein
MSERQIDPPSQALKITPPEDPSTPRQQLLIMPTLGHCISSYWSEPQNTPRHRTIICIVYHCLSQVLNTTIPRARFAVRGLRGT